MAKLFVKKPFSSEELEENKNKEENTQEIQENKEQEKPVNEPTSKTSEETHGGDESTNSIKNSPNPSSNSNYEEKQENNSKQNEQSEENNLQNSKENEIKQNTNDQNNNSNEYNTEQNTNQNSNNHEQESYEENANTNTNQNNNNINSEQQQKDNSNNNNTEQNASQQNNSNNSQVNNNQNNSNNNATENNNNENEDEEDEDNDNENKKQLPSGQHNTRQVVDLTKSISAYTKFVQTEFYRFIETFAEEKLKIFDNKQPEEYNIKKLMLRKYQKKPLNHYKGNKIKDTVILILDNSGSMDWWSKNLRILSLIALQRNDIQIYIAPNGDIQHMITKYSNYIPVYHPQIFKSLVNKKIIYVGDFDGADTPIELSWHNEVIWICPETRYRRFLSHNWVHYSEDKFNGVFIRAYNLDEMFNGLKKITRYFKLFIDFHINDKFQDD